MSRQGPPLGSNVPYYLKTAAVAAIFLAGVIGSADAVKRIATGHSLFEDGSAPEIASSVAVSPSCFATRLEPNVTIQEPDRGFFQKRTGLRVVSLHVGAEKVGEWPMVDGFHETFQLQGPAFVLYTAASGERILAVAEDRQGNTSVEDIGPYEAPHCYEAVAAEANGCACADFPAGPYLAIPRDVEANNGREATGDPQS